MAHVGPVLQPYQQEVPLEGGVEQLLGEHVGGAAKGDYLPVQQDGVVEIGGGEGEGGQEGGRAGAVGPNQAGQTAGLYVEGDALQGGAAVVAGPDVVGFQGQWGAALLSHLKDPGETRSGCSCTALALLCKADLKVCSYRPYHLSLACDDL